jgi:hypothetical protein
MNSAKRTQGSRQRSNSETKAAATEGKIKEREKWNSAGALPCEQQREPDQSPRAEQPMGTRIFCERKNSSGRKREPSKSGAAQESAASPGRDLTREHCATRAGKN